MLRLKILASTVPLMLAAFLARGETEPANQPCITMGETSVQLAMAPWQTQASVAFTDNPSYATVRVQIVDNPEIADFAIADDVASTSEAGCRANASTRLIGISSQATASEPIIYLSRDDDADYRIYVRSRSITPRDAAALLVGANGGHHRIAQASL